MTLAEKFDQWAEEYIRQGMEKGMDKGMEHGMEHGMEKGIEKGVGQGEAWSRPVPRSWLGGSLACGVCGALI